MAEQNKNTENVNGAEKINVKDKATTRKTAGGAVAADGVATSRTAVHRTLKAYLNGAFVRSESGRTYRVETTDGPLEVVDGSRKDARDAIRAGREGASRWSQSSPYLRGQILHRLAEMLETAPDLDAFAVSLGLQGGHRAAADVALHYAGYPDKLSQVLGSVNAVAGHASSTEPLGVGLTVVYAGADTGLVELVEIGSAALAAGNSVLVVARGGGGALACVLAERLAVSDIPAGVWQVLSCDRDEPILTLAGASDVRALDVTAHPRRVDLEALAAETLTRCRVAPVDSGRSGAHRSLEQLRWQIDYRTSVAVVGR